MHFPIVELCQKKKKRREPIKFTGPREPLSPWHTCTGPTADVPKLGVPRAYAHKHGPSASIGRPREKRREEKEYKGIKFGVCTLETWDPGC